VRCDAGAAAVRCSTNHEECQCMYATLHICVHARHLLQLCALPDLCSDLPSRCCLLDGAGGLNQFYVIGIPMNTSAGAPPGMAGDEHLVAAAPGSQLAHAWSPGMHMHTHAVGPAAAAVLEPQGAPWYASCDTPQQVAAGGLVP
jgi:hypothetical protein